MSSMAPFERAMVVSYVVLSVTIRPQFAIECLQRSNQQGGSLWAQISGCSPWSRSMMFGSAESERPTLTNVKLFSKNSNLCDHNPQRHRQTDGGTDRRHRNTALCTKVHRAVKTDYCRGSPAPGRLPAALVSRKFAVARARVRGPRQQADVSAAG